MKRCPKCGGNVATACDQCTYCGVIISTYVPESKKQQPVNVHRKVGTEYTSGNSIKFAGNQRIHAQSDHVIQCPHCGKTVSKIYDCCFNCGYDLLYAKLEHNKILESRKKQVIINKNKLIENTAVKNDNYSLNNGDQTENKDHTMKCPQCGETISNTHDYCFKCGYALRKVKTARSKRYSSNKEPKRGKVLFFIVAIIFLIVGVLSFSQSKKNVCPFSKLSSNQTLNDVVSIFGTPNERTKWTFPDNNGTNRIRYVDEFTYTFMNNTGLLRITYSGEKISSAYFWLDYPLQNPSVFDNSVCFANETVKKLASHFIKFYTKEYGNYKLKRDSYVWSLDDGETISLEFDPSEEHIPIKLKWHSKQSESE